jgi:lipopolysaccharide export system protein LptA
MKKRTIQRYLRNSLTIGVSLALCGTVARAQDAGVPPQASGPVDIQANEQEFAGDQVIARGNVKVTCKDTVITGPEANLSRSPDTGSPQSAVFTGHPHLVQNGAVMDSDTLTLDIANHGILAEGHAHSEVVSSESPPPPKPATPTSTATGASQNAAKAPAIPMPAAASGGVEKIITDSDRQEYDSTSDKFIAMGHVRVKHADIRVTSERLQLVYGADKKPETAIFTGKAIANQGKNVTRADVVTYNLITRRLQATGHVRSKVIQEKTEGDTSSKPKVAYGAGAAAAAGITDGAAMSAAMSNEDKLKGGVADNEEEIFILSDSQDYNKQTGRICADGNVKVYYEDSVGLGPRAVLVRGENGKAERIVFTGRSQVNQPHKWWIGDQIILVVSNKHVIAQGNTRAYVERQPVNELKKKQDDDSKNKGSNTQLASRSRASQQLSAARIEATR